MLKLIPHWGYSPQPGSTYYLQKLSHDIFGIVDHSTGDTSIYICDERVGPKNTDHTLSYLTHYLFASGQVPSWVKRLHLFMDNACSTNKNCYAMAWAMEMVQQEKLDFIRISFMIAGHTKFAPDLLFSKVSRSFSRSDVFSTKELVKVARQFATVTHDKGNVVRQWRTNLDKYSKFPGIHDKHDIIFVRNPTTHYVMVKTHNLCFQGSLENGKIHVTKDYTLE